MLWLVTHGDDVLLGPLSKESEIDEFMERSDPYWKHLKIKPQKESFELGYRAEKIVLALITQIDQLQKDMNDIRYDVDKVKQEIISDYPY